MKQTVTEKQLEALWILWETPARFCRVSPTSQSRSRGDWREVCCCEHEPVTSMLTAWHHTQQTDVCPVQQLHTQRVNFL